MREICLDTETTGLSSQDDRIVEIGCVELENLIPTGRVFHVYINPQRPMQAAAEKVHGLSDYFLSDKPVFKSVVGDFLDFIGNDPLVIHNAAFDLGMLNAEMARLGKEPIKNEIRDTLLIARGVRPGRRNSLDALCAEYGVSTEKRVKHGALLDSEILAQVYLHLRGGRQFGLELPVEHRETKNAVPVPGRLVSERKQRLRLTASEFHTHLAMVKTMGEGLKKDELPVWLSYESYMERFKRDNA